MKIDNFLKIGTLTLALFLAFSASAAECSQRTKDSTAKLIANREMAYTNLLLTKSNQQIEIVKQQSLTNAIKERYDHAIAGASSYVPSVKPKIIDVLTKQKEKSLQSRAKEEARVLKNMTKAVESAEKKYNKAANKVPNNLDCTL